MQPRKFAEKIDKDYSVLFRELKGQRQLTLKQAVEYAKELDCDPIEALAMIAKDQTNTPELRFQANKELAQYVAPKRKAVEMDAALDGGLNINIQKFNLESETDGYGGTDPD